MEHGFLPRHFRCGHSSSSNSKSSIQEAAEMATASERGSSMHFEEIGKSARAAGGHLLLAMAGPPSIAVAMAAIAGGKGGSHYPV